MRSIMEGDKIDAVCGESVEITGRLDRFLDRITTL
jgi:hypothetical protein